MVDWPKRVERQLRTEELVALPDIAAQLRDAAAGDAFALGIKLGSAASNVGRHGELLLLDGDERGWALLATTRRLRALGIPLFHNYTGAHSEACALAILEALQFDELVTAASVGDHLARAFSGQWDQGSRATPSKTELEALAFHLLALRVPSKAPSVSGFGLVELFDFAGAAGTTIMPVEDAFGDAWRGYWELCREGAGIPRGARLSAAPILACVASRLAIGTLSEGEVAKVLADVPEPFSEFRRHRMRRVDPLFEQIIEHCKQLAATRGFAID